MAMNTLQMAAFTAELEKIAEQEQTQDDNIAGRRRLLRDSSGKKKRLGGGRRPRMAPLGECDNPRKVDS